MDVRLDSDLFISLTHFSGKLSFSHKIWWEDPGKGKKKQTLGTILLELKV